MLKILILSFTVIFILRAGAQPKTVITNHSNVNLWSGAGRTGHKSLGKLERYEEVQVLNIKNLNKGEVWYQIQLVQYYNGKRILRSGWVDAKFFNDINVPDTNQPSTITGTEGNAPCTTCAKTQNSTSSKLAKDLNTISSHISKGFVWPTRGYVRSGFGYRRHPIKGIVKLHRGTDISGHSGAQVNAAKAGKIEVSASGCQPGRKSCNGGAGNMITIDHGDGTKTRYLHLSQKCPLPRKGTFVKQGVTIACVGATGSVTGPHLHFEVKKNGNWINPLTVLSKRN